MSGGPPPMQRAPSLARQWSETADPLKRVLIAKKASRLLGEKGRKLFKSAITAAPPSWTLHATMLVTGDLTIPSSASTADLYAAVGAKLPPATGFKIIRGGK